MPLLLHYDYSASTSRVIFQHLLDSQEGGRQKRQVNQLQAAPHSTHESDFVSQSLAHSSCTARPHPHRQNASGPISASVSSSWQMGQTSPSLTSRRSTARLVNRCFNESIHLIKGPSAAITCTRATMRLSACSSGPASVNTNIALHKLPNICCQTCTLSR